MDAHTENQSSNGATPHLDVFVEESAPWSGILALLEHVRPQWSPKDIKLKYFTEGITNLLMGCWVEGGPAGDMVLVRVYGQETERFVDRKRERETFHILHAYGHGPQLYCSFQNGICYQFVQGAALDDQLLRQPHIYRRILPGIPDIHVLRNQMESLKEHFAPISSPTVLCHNDLLTKNIIYNQAEGTVCFIDYEYADYNYQAFDIANHFNEFAGVETIDYSQYPSVELQRDWLAVYLQSYNEAQGLTDTTVTEKDVTRLYVKVCKFSLVSHFMWGLWALLQARYSTIDFDFLRYARARFNHFSEKKEEYFAMKLPD